MGAPEKGIARAVACVVVFTLAGCSSLATSKPDLDGPEAEAAVEAAACGALSGEGAHTVDGGLPALRLPCLGNGPDVTLSSLTGRPTLVNLWASWCAPCREEMPLLQQAFAEHGQDIRFLGVVTRDEPAVAADVAAATGVTYPSVVDVDGTLLTQLGVPGLPVTLAVDPAGRIVGRQIGQMTSAELASLVQLLKDSRAAGAGPSG